MVKVSNFSMGKKAEKKKNNRGGLRNRKNCRIV